MLGRLSNNPNVLRSYSRQQFRGNLSEATLIFETKERQLKYPILNDCLSKATEVRVYPRSAHVRVILFQIIIFSHLGFANHFKINLHSCHAILLSYI